MVACPPAVSLRSSRSTALGLAQRDHLHPSRPASEPPSTSRAHRPSPPFSAASGTASTSPITVVLDSRAPCARVTAAYSPRPRSAANHPAARPLRPPCCTIAGPRADVPHTTAPVLRESGRPHVRCDRRSADARASSVALCRWHDLHSDYPVDDALYFTHPTTVDQPIVTPFHLPVGSRLASSDRPQPAMSPLWRTATVAPSHTIRGHSRRRPHRLRRPSLIVGHLFQYHVSSALHHVLVVGCCDDWDVGVRLGYYGSCVVWCWRGICLVVGMLVMSVFCLDVCVGDLVADVRCCPAGIRRRLDAWTTLV